MQGSNSPTVNILLPGDRYDVHELEKEVVIDQQLAAKVVVRGYISNTHDRRPPYLSGVICALAGTAYRKELKIKNYFK